MLHTHLVLFAAIAFGVSSTMAVPVVGGFNDLEVRDNGKLFARGKCAGTESCSGSERPPKRQAVTRKEFGDPAKTFNWLMPAAPATHEQIKTQTRMPVTRKEFVDPTEGLRWLMPAAHKQTPPMPTIHEQVEAESPPFGYSLPPVGAHDKQNDEQGNGATLSQTGKTRPRYGGFISAGFG